MSNPSIWRPILDIRDATTAYLRAIQANSSLSGVFNVASGNFTVGQVGDIVKDELESLLGEHVAIEIGAIEDYRNYKVSIEKARTTLGFRPKYDLEATIEDLYSHRAEFADSGERQVLQHQGLRRDGRASRMTERDVALLAQIGTYDRWADLERYAKSFLELEGSSCDLYLNVMEDEDLYPESRTREMFAKLERDFPEATITTAPNRGTDVGPFLRQIGGLLESGLSYRTIFQAPHQDGRALDDGPCVGSWRARRRSVAAATCSRRGATSA